MSHDTHDSHDSHGSKEKFDGSSFYNWFMYSILLIFALFAVFALLPTKTDGFEGKQFTYITENTTVDIPSDISSEWHKFYLLAPGVILKAKFKLGEDYPAYPKNLLNRKSGFVVRDDKGNTNVRQGTLHVSIQNIRDEDNLLGLGRRKDLNEAGIDFSDPTKEETPGRVTTTWTNVAWYTFYWVLAVTILFIIYFTLEKGIANKKPLWWLGQAFGKKDEAHEHELDEAEEHNKSTHGEHGGNPVPRVFVFNTATAILFGVITVIALFVNSGAALLYAVFPLIGFMFFTTRIGSEGITVPAHTLKGVYGIDTNDEITTLVQGKAWVPRTSFTVGAPAGQGLKDLNLDKVEVDLTPDDGKTEVVLGDDNFVELTLQHGLFQADKDAGTEWLIKFPGKSIDDLKKYIKEKYWTAVAVTVDDFNLKTIRKSTERTDHSGAKYDGFEFSEKVDIAMFKLFKRDGVEMLGHTTTGPIRINGDLKKSMQLKGILKTARAGVKASYSDLTPQESEKAARLWMQISQENYNIHGLDKSTLPAAVELAKALIAKKS